MPTQYDAYLVDREQVLTFHGVACYSLRGVRRLGSTLDIGRRTGVPASDTQEFILAERLPEGVLQDGDRHLIPVDVVEDQEPELVPWLDLPDRRVRKRRASKSSNAEGGADRPATPALAVGAIGGRAVRVGDDLTDLIERMPALEEHAAVRLDKCSARMDEFFGQALVVMGEVHPARGDLLQSDIDVEVSVYDAVGRVVGTVSPSSQQHRDDQSEFRKEFYFRFDTFAYHAIRVPTPCRISKIRVFPRTA